MNNKAGVMTCLFTTGFTQHFKSTVEIYCSEDSFQITTAIEGLDSSVNGSETTNVTSTNPSPANTGTTTTHVTSANVLTSVTIHDGKFHAATSQILEAIDDTTLASIFAS